MNFDDYIQQLLGNRNPQGNMLTGVSTAPNFYNQAQNNDYYNNPYRRQDSIDAGMAKKLADEQELARQLGIPANTGMLAGDSGGYDSPTASEGVDMGVDAGLGGPGGNTQGGGPAMSPAEAANIGLGLFGLNPLGIAASFAIHSFNQPAPPTTNTPMAVANNGRANAIPVDPHVQAAAASAAAAAQASNVAEGGGGYSGPGGVGGSGVSAGGGNAAGGFGIGGW